MEQEIETVELTIAEGKRLMERRAAAQRLAKNKDFQKLVLEGYFVDEAARLALLYSDPNMAQHREHIEKDLYGVGGFKRYMSTIIQMGNIAENEMSDHEQTLEELRAEDLNSDAGFQPVDGGTL